MNRTIISKFDQHNVPTWHNQHQTSEVFYGMSDLALKITDLNQAIIQLLIVQTAR